MIFNGLGLPKCSQNWDIFRIVWKQWFYEKPWFSLVKLMIFEVRRLQKSSKIDLNTRWEKYTSKNWFWSGFLRPNAFKNLPKSTKHWQKTSKNRCWKKHEKKHWKMGRQPQQDALVDGMRKASKQSLESRGTLKSLGFLNISFNTPHTSLKGGWRI